MILFTCVDDRMGMTYNHRRQSRDRILRKWMISIVNDSCLWMNQYSADQFQDEPWIIIDEYFLDKAAPGDYCFAELPPLLPYESKMEQIILYHWNRRYPEDLYFDIPLKEHKWELKSTMDFTGSSHAVITEEIYER